MLKKHIIKYKDDVKKCIDDLKHRDTFYKQIPNLLTISRVVGMIPVNIMFLCGNYLSAIILIGLLLSTDFFDGKIARKYNIESKFGADLDAICDKLMVLGLTLPLLGRNPILILNLLFEGLITSVNVIGRINGLDSKTLQVGKVKTWLLSLTLGLGYFVFVFRLPSVILLFASLITLIGQSITFKDYVLEYDKLKKKKQSDEMHDKVDEEKDKTLNNQRNLIKALMREKEFILSSIEPNKVYTGKKRIRKKCEKNNHY